MAKRSLLLLLFFIKIADSLEFCQESCSRTGQEIRFPFGLTGGRCSYPGFNLSCFKGKPILTLPLSGNFIVQSINYLTQQVYITDPGNCFAERLLTNFSLSGSLFVREPYRSFTLLNCSSNVTLSAFPTSSRPISCLSSHNSTVVAVPNYYYPVNQPQTVPTCTVINSSVDVPISLRRWTERDSYLNLMWIEPDCSSCEERSGTCGFKDNTSFDVGCYNLPSSSRALPRSAKYGIVIGIGIPGLLCIIGIVGYLCSRLRTCRQSRQSATQLTTALPHSSSVATAGLDGPTIELYPKTLLGESRRLPKPNDNTCPICLCEYQAKETLRTIPECNHYFHADCVDAWLKMNATCPLCRNTPDVSARATPSSLSASSFATTPSSSMSDSSSSLYSGP